MRRESENRVPFFNIRRAREEMVMPTGVKNHLSKTSEDWGKKILVKKHCRPMKTRKLFQVEAKEEEAQETGQNRLKLRTVSKSSFRGFSK